MNSVILIGRITKDLQLQYNANGTAFLAFSIAVDRKYKDQNGQRQADFISCKAFKHNAEFIAKYFAKGRKIAITGSIQTGKYEKNGATIYTTDVVIDSAEFVEKLEAQTAATAPAPQQLAPDISNATQAVQQIAQVADDSLPEINDLPFEF